MAEQRGDFLLINDNNTRTKFALADRTGLVDHRSLRSEEIGESSLRKTLEDWTYEGVVLASVVPRHLEPIRESQEGHGIVEVGPSIRLGVEVDFPDPSSIGADRLANAAAVADRVDGKPVIVVDFGTAVTFDIIDPRPAYIGGVIAPGLDAMRHYLHERTALLPEIDIARPRNAVGRTTIEAMQSGAFHGYRGLVREILRQVEEELESSAKVIATGGYAALIAHELEGVTSVEPLLTLEGLRKIALLNFS